MAQQAIVTLNGSTLGNGLQEVLMAGDIQPGDSPSYETCKNIYLFHPLGAKIAEKPVRIAQSQKRKISIPDSPEARVKEEFENTWEKVGVDKHIFATRVQARVYGIASIALIVQDMPTNVPVDLTKLSKQKYSFNVYDPLNTAGSLVLNQDPLAPDFQHVQEIRVSGSTFHRSRTRVIMNEFPVYISFTPSTYGFTGRSVYQRSLFPLKSFIQTMITNDMVSVKAGVIVAKIKQVASVVSGAARAMFGMKRNVVKEAVVGNVISIGTDGEAIESLDLKNLSEPFGAVRKHIIEDIASGTPMPAKMLTEESFAEGFGEGTEDAKDQARFVDSERKQMAPLYEFFDDIIMHLAWTRDFFAVIQHEFPEQYKGITYEAAFCRWKNSFKAEWPNLLEEPDSEKVKVDDVKLRALIAVLQVLMPRLDPVNLAIVVQFVADNMNDMKLLFSSPLNLDYDALEAYDPQTELKEPATPKPFSAADSSDGAIDDLMAAVARLKDYRKQPPRKAA